MTDNFLAKIIPHYFASVATIVNSDGTKMDNYLETEVDFTLGYKLTKSIAINGGYSQMFATESMEALRRRK
ncbi:MAG: hypothetical protein L3J09_07290 [Flavobacteriaceae bacterium]|nr:hypothetical protein [Flavobacteriaceae bacterium]